MVKVYREVKIVFTISTTNTLNQIRNFVSGTLIPGMNTRFNNHLSGFPSRVVEPTIAVNDMVTRLNTTSPAIYEINLMYEFSIDSPIPDDSDGNQTGGGAALKTAWHNFIEDCREGLKTVIQNRAGVTLLSIHCHLANGQTLEVTL